MTPDEARAQAALATARIARNIKMDQLEADYPNDLDALAVYEQIVTARVSLEWTRDSGRAVKVIAVVASPLIIVALAVIWTAWRIDAGIKKLRRVDQPPRKHRRT